MIIQSQSSVHNTQDSANVEDVAKVIAILAMIIDHIGLFYSPEHVWCRLVGRIAMPIFMFCAGYHHKYIRKDIIACAMLVQILVNPILNNKLNILFSALIGQILLRERAIIDNKLIQIVVLCLCAATLFINVNLEYELIPLMFMISGKLRQSDKEYKWQLSYALTVYCIYTYQRFESTSIVLALPICYILLIMDLKKLIKLKKIKYISRNILQIYVGHLAIFMILKVLGT